MESTTFDTPAWLMIGLTKSVAGHLELAGGQLSLNLVTDECAFDSPLSDVNELKFPWYYFSAGFKLAIAGEHYRVSFLDQHDSQIMTGIRNGKAWKALLLAETDPHQWT